MMKVLYLLNFAGKAGTERYVETLVRYLNPVSYTHLVWGGGTRSL